LGQGQANEQQAHHHAHSTSAKAHRNVSGRRSKGPETKLIQQGPTGARRLRAEQTRRSARRALHDELLGLHQLSLEVMHERGILPPLYGGTHLGQHNECRVVRLNAPHPGEKLAVMGLVLQPANAEPNPDLAVARDLAGFVGRSGPLFMRSGVTLYIAQENLHPSPQGDLYEALDHVCQGRPFAIFPHAGKDRKRRNKLKSARLPVNCSGTVLCAENPAVLEAAVWDFRLALALERECQIIAEEGAVPAEILPATSVRDLVAYHELLVMRALRLYGCTSPLHDQQAQLDVLRDDSGDLRVPLPLNPAVEPVQTLANDRRRRYATSGTLVHLRAEGTPLATFWPQIRASRYFCLRQTAAQIDTQSWRITGYRERPGFDWLLADDLNRLYRLVHLYSLYECLAVTGLIEGGDRPGEAFYDALEATGQALARPGQDAYDEP
jgi:hypothetical protein